MSNTAGAASYDRDGRLAKELESATGVSVLTHKVKKPGCKDEIMSYFQKNPEVGVTHPSQVVIIGDRLMTDMMLANLMGSRGIWIKDGVAPLSEKSMVWFSISLPYRTLLTLPCSSPSSSTGWLLFFLPVGSRPQSLPAHLSNCIIVNYCSRVYLSVVQSPPPNLLARATCTAANDQQGQSYLYYMKYLVNIVGYGFLF